MCYSLLFLCYEPWSEALDQQQDENERANEEKLISLTRQSTTIYTKL